MKRIFSLILSISIIFSLFTVCAFNTSAASYGDIYLRGTFNGWDIPAGYKMTDMGNGNYLIKATFAKDKYEYKFANTDWSFNVPDENAKLDFSQQTTLLMEVNTNTKLYHATPIKGDTNLLNIKKETDKVRFTCAWAEHNNEILTETNGKLGYTTNKSDDKTYWDIIPTATDNVYYIRNNKTGNFIYYSGSSVLCSKTGNTTDAGKWYIDRSTGNFRLISFSDITKSVNLEKQDGYAQYGYVPAFYTSSQFSAEFSSYFYTLSEDKVFDTLGEASATSGTSITSNALGETKTWELKTDISSAPKFTAANSPLLEAVYNLSVEESILNQFESKYGTAFYTGVNWKKVWTRDTAMACQYSLADIFPQIALNCAKEKVVGTKGLETFEEDTGSGGSYPVSTDKIITMLSVWEIYLSTGDKSVLEYFYPIAKNTIEQDLNVAYDEHSKLYKGETCGTDWRDQTYPDWVSETIQNGLPNIAESKAASVNIIYTRVFEIMSRCASILNKDANESKMWKDMSESLEKSISERLWSDDLSVYAAWEYPSYMGSPLAYKADVISNGYATMFDVGTEKQIKSILENYPLVTYGAPTVYPQKQGTLHNANKVYHNRGVWPGWEATLMLGAKQHGYNEVSEEIFNSCVRGAAEYLTNKEVIDFTTGQGLESDRQLWSIAATLSGYYKVLFGMEYSEDGLSFKPFIPSWCKGPFTLSSYPYQKAKLNITLSGEGDTISKITVDGKEVSADYIFPSNATGTHNIEITVTDSKVTHKMNLNDEKNHVVCPSLPKLSYSNGVLTFEKQAGLTYKLFDGTQYIDLTTNTYKVDTSVYRCYSLVSISKDGVWSEFSKPIQVGPSKTKIKIEAESGTYKKANLKTSPSGYSGSGVVDDTMTNTYPVIVNANIETEGVYLLSCVYNNKGETNSSTNCAIRSVYIDGKDVGSLVFPVMNFYYQTSTHLPIKLTKGQHEIKVLYDSANFFDRNMNITKNSVQYDYFTLELANDLFEEEKEYALLGDSDTDENITIVDATTVQKVLAKYDMDKYDEFASDVDENKVVEIVDATLIQKYLASYETHTRIGQWVERKAFNQ